MADQYAPRPEHKFSFGLWTVSNRGRDPFGRSGQTRAGAGRRGGDARRSRRLGRQSSRQRSRPHRRYARRARSHRQGVPGAPAPGTTSSCRWRRSTCSSIRSFATAPSRRTTRRVRAYAIQKTMRAMDLGAELGAKTSCSGAAARGPRRTRAAARTTRSSGCGRRINYLVRYSLDKKYGYRFALEAKPNEPRGDIYMATTGNYLGLIPTLEHPELVGVNPEFAHETMAGLNFLHAVAQAHEAGKLFHIDLNDQAPGRYDQDYRFGSTNIKGGVLSRQVPRGRRATTARGTSTRMRIAPRTTTVSAISPAAACGPT